MNQLTERERTRIRILESNMEDLANTYFHTICPKEGNEISNSITKIEQQILLIDPTYYNKEALM